MPQNKSIPQSSLEWSPRGFWGPLKWKELHGRALAHLPMEGEQVWFDSFVNSIPCPHCQKHFQLFVESCPPNFESRAFFFAWTIKAHNYVNRALQKPEFSFGEALMAHQDILKAEERNY